MNMHIHFELFDQIHSGLMQVKIIKFAVIHKKH